MNKRLHKLAQYIESGVGVIDVGTDHGYLPVFLAANGYSGNIFASDIRPKPLEAARRSAEAAGVTDRISFLLCDGLDKCEPEKVDTIVVSGMGGDTICGILDRAEWCMDKCYRLVLQPMTKPHVLRYWLINNGFEIVSESLVKDSGMVYPIIVARFGGSTSLSDAELFVGKLEFVQGNEYFDEYLFRQISRIEAVIAGMQRSDIYASCRQKLLDEILVQLRGVK